MRRIIFCFLCLLLVAFCFSEEKSSIPFSYGTYIIQGNPSIPYSHCIFSPEGDFYIYENRNVPSSIQKYNFHTFLYEDLVIIKIGDYQYSIQKNKDKIYLFPLSESATGKIVLKFLSLVTSP